MSTWPYDVYHIIWLICPVFLITFQVVVNAGGCIEIRKQNWLARDFLSLFSWQSLCRYLFWLLLKSKHISEDLRHLVWILPVDGLETVVPLWAQTAGWRLLVVFRSFTLVKLPFSAVEVLPLLHQAWLRLMTSHLETDHFTFELELD